MNRSDEAIDKVFAGLRDVEAAEGMERRIMAAVRQRAAAPRTLPLRWFAVGGFALAAAAVIALLAGPRPASVPAPVQANVQPQTQSPPPEPAPARPRRRTPAVRANAEAPVPATNVLAASFPAPPMPLTEQERLLVQVAQRGQPAELPVLDPDALAQQETRSEQVFEAVLASAEQPSIMKQKEDIR
jgi:hypothetical protein